MARQAHEAGATVFLDAVHLAPHASIDVHALGADFLVCSAYKFFGPHIGVMWGRRALLESLDAYKVRPAPDDLPGKWMTGTQNHEGIVGVTAAIRYLANLGGATGDDGRKQALRRAFDDTITPYERTLMLRLLEGLNQLPRVRVWGIADPNRIRERLPTVSITHATRTPADVATRLGELGLFVWHGNYYALQLTEMLGLEPEGMVRIGMVHYNTDEEVDRLLAAIADL
jgi:selenocysteine lyase/cysteine desulfurase